MIFSTIRPLQQIRALSRGSLDQLSIKSKLILMLLLASGFSTLLTALLGYRSGQINLSDRVFNQLTSIRASKAYQIESYFRNIQHHTQTLSEDLSIVAAVQQFDAAFQQLEQTTPPASASKALQTYYSRNFLPRLLRNNSGTPNLQAYLPGDPAARILQNLYIAANPNPVGKKQQLLAAEDGSTYSEVHRRYHPVFRNIVAKFGYYDMFLINPQGKIVYTVFKETDFATSLQTGPYKDSNLARLVGKVIASKQKDFTRLEDFAPYAPSYGAPASFIAAPIHDGSRLVGVLAFQLPVDEINRVMTGNQQWRQDGLGDSGEAILVGHDNMMRSASRFYLENPKGFLALVKSRGVKQEEIDLLGQTTILHQPVATQDVVKALAGETGTLQVNDYRGVPVLSSFAPLDIPGLHWVILAQMDLSEAYAPVNAFGRQMLIAVTLLILLVTLLAMALAHLFVKPVQQLIDSARKVTSGELTGIPDLKSKDEFGELGQSFNRMVQSLQTQTELVDQKNQENERLLFSVFPSAIARRLQRGDTQIAEEVTNVAVLFADLKGFSKLVASLSAYESLTILNDLVGSFDDLAEQFGVEKVKTIGDNYLGVCGLSVPYLDHDKRTLDFAIEMLGLLRRFNIERGYQLSLQIGIHSGDIVAGIVGKSRVVYDIWGDTVKQAHALSQGCPAGAVVISTVVHHRLEDLYSFEPAAAMADGVQAWRLTSTKLAAATVVPPGS